MPPLFYKSVASSWFRVVGSTIDGGVAVGGNKTSVHIPVASTGQFFWDRVMRSNPLTSEQRCICLLFGPVHKLRFSNIQVCKP